MTTDPLLSRSTIAFSTALALLAGIVSAAGLFVPQLYRDNALVVAAFRGNDLITLVVAVPILLGGLAFARRGSGRGAIFVAGMLWYMVYNYSFYMFGAAFNAVFLAYVALFAGSTSILINYLATLDVASLGRSFHADTPLRPVAVFMAFFAALMAFLWISRAAGFIVTGNVPTDILQTGHPTGVVYAVDLSLLVPSLIAGAVLLWKRHPWGAVVATAVMVKATTYALAMIAMSWFADRAGIPGAWELMPLWSLLGFGCLASAWAMMKNVGERQPTTVVSPQTRSSSISE